MMCTVTSVSVALKLPKRDSLRAGYTRIGEVSVCMGFFAAGERAIGVAVGDRLTVSFVLASGIVLAWHKSSFTGIERHLAVGGRH